MVVSPAAEPAAGGEPSPKSWWLYLLLGIVLTLGGVIILGDIGTAGSDDAGTAVSNINLASIFAALVISWAILIVGIVQVIHAFSSTGWKGFVLDLLLGLLYIAAGYILLSNPLGATVKITLILGIIWLVSGFFRIILSFVLWRQAGLILLFSGIIGALAGGLILAEWPNSSLWVLGLLLGVDLLFHGIAWITYSLSLPSKNAPQSA